MCDNQNFSSQHKLISLCTLTAFYRLTGPYMLVLGCWATLFEYSGSGPNWPQGSQQGAGWPTYCKEVWWTYMLYAQNLVKVESYVSNKGRKSQW